MYSKFSFGEVYCRIYGRKFSFTATRVHSNALLQFELKLERCKPHKATRHPTKCDVINDVKLFPTVYHRIYCRKFLTLSNQTSRCKLMCIRINVTFFWYLDIIYLFSISLKDTIW